MSDQQRAERRSAWVTSEEMAALTGASVATVKRRAVDGKPIRCPDGTLVHIESERIERPQGWEWRVRAVSALPDIERRSERSDQETPPALTSGDQQLVTRSLDILDTLLRANVESIGRLDDRIECLRSENAELRERAGRAEERAIAADRRADLAERERQAAQDALVQAEDERDASRLELSSALVEIATLRSDRDAVKAERDRLAAELAQARAEAARRTARRWWRFPFFLRPND